MLRTSLERVLSITSRYIIFKLENSSLINDLFPIDSRSVKFVQNRANTFTLLVASPLQNSRIFTTGRDKGGRMAILLSILVILAPGKKRASLAAGCAEGGWWWCRVYAITRVARFQECGARSQPMPAARQ